METKTMRTRLNKTPVDTPLVHCSVRESVSSVNLVTTAKSSEGSVSCFPVRSGYNFEKNKSSDKASMSGVRVFVLSMSGKPLTPCKKQKARKLLIGGVARVVWNKFGQFGIQMLVQTREFTPNTILGMDWGTKFEGYSVITGNENSFNVMWLLPDKKALVRKLKERRILRRARRFRNCRRRQARFDNRNREGFIAPSQLMMVQSRLRCMMEIMKCFPISKVAVEDVKFNHRDKKWGKNFSTMEVGKNKIYDYIINLIGRGNLIKFEGTETKRLREKFGVKKSSNKSAENFNSHCVDSFSIACEISFAYPNLSITIVDDTYRPKRRRLHDTQFAKGGIREKYSTGNFKGIKKGCVCEFGQMAGGTKNCAYIYPWDNHRIGKALSKIAWLSHNFKTKEGSIPPLNKLGGLLEHDL